MSDQAAATTAHRYDLGFTIVAAADDKYRVKFKVYALECCEDPPLWHRAGSPSHPDPVEDLADAAIYLHGEVKWDGCSNWHFDEQDRGMLHGCSRRDLANLGEVLTACWDMAEQLCTGWNSDVAERE